MNLLWIIPLGIVLLWLIYVGSCIVLKFTYAMALLVAAKIKKDFTEAEKHL